MAVAWRRAPRELASAQVRAVYWAASFSSVVVALVRSLTFLFGVAFYIAPPCFAPSFFIFLC